MLVVISDIHLVDASAGTHNVPFEAFRNVFSGYVSKDAADNGAKEVTVLLLGDVVDLIRTERWLEAEDRPWGKNGLADVERAKRGEEVRGTATEMVCLEILEDIASENSETFAFFKDDFKEAVTDGTSLSPSDVRLIYIPGNHDRLCNVYPAVRDRLRDLLGITASEGAVDGDPDGEWWYRHEFINENYGVFARHGHEHDPLNYGASTEFGRNAQIEVSIGEVIATEFAVKIPWLLENMKDEDWLRREFERDPEVRKDYPAFVERTRDMDNIRPLSAVLEYFYYRLEKVKTPAFRKALDEAFDRTVSEFFEIPFVLDWESPRTHHDVWVGAISRFAPIRRGVSGILERTDATSTLRPLVTLKERLDIREDPGMDKHTRAAYEEPVWRENDSIRYILYGHTHDPVVRPLDRTVRPLDRTNERDATYINTGTWRQRIQKTVSLDDIPDYFPSKQLTYVTFYSKDEDPGKKPGSVSFDMWTGTKVKDYPRD